VSGFLHRRQLCKPVFGELQFLICQEYSTEPSFAVKLRD